MSYLKNKGYKVIVEGQIPKYRGKEWGKPDIFVLKGSSLEKIVEVIVGDSYEGKQPNSVVNKCKKIKEYYNPPEIIVFEPIGYTSNYYRASFKGFDDPIKKHQCLQEKWKKEGLEITFWNEYDLYGQEEKVLGP